MGIVAFLWISLLGCHYVKYNDITMMVSQGIPENPVLECI